MSGGKSSSSSSSASTTTNIDGRSVADAQGQAGYQTSNARDNGVVLSNVTGSISLTDNGAVTKAFDFGTNLANLTGDAFMALLDVSKQNTATAEHINQTATEAIQKSAAIATTAQDSNRFLVAGGLAVVALVAVKVWAK